MRVTNGAAERNGAASTLPASRTEPKRSASAGRLKAGPAPSPPKLAHFAPVDAQPKDAPMWPVHSLIWWQPGLKPSLPSASDLRIERRHQVPIPDFLYLEMRPAGRPRPSLASPCDPLLPRRQPSLPQSGLVPLGWDPRADVKVTGPQSRKEGEK
jgi:hypothetical protein